MRISPPSAAREDDRDLARERHELLGDRGLAAQLRELGRGVGAGVDPDLALAVVAGAPDLEDRGAADLGERARRARSASSPVPTRACGRPSRSRNCFWIWRSWIVRSTARAGPHRRDLSRARRAASAGTCSVSSVITSTWRARWRAASRSSSAPTTTPSATCAVGQRGLGSSTTIAVAHAARRERHHAAELTAAEHADRRARAAERRHAPRQRLAEHRAAVCARAIRVEPRARPRDRRARGSPPRAAPRSPRRPRRSRACRPGCPSASARSTAASRAR